MRRSDDIRTAKNIQPEFKPDDRVLIEAFVVSVDPNAKGLMPEIMTVRFHGLRSWAGKDLFGFYDLSAIHPAPQPPTPGLLSFEQAVTLLTEGKRIGVKDEPGVSVELCLNHRGTTLYWKRSDYTGPAEGTLLTFSDIDVLTRKYFVIEEERKP